MSVQQLGVDRMKRLRKTAGDLRDRLFYKQRRISDPWAIRRRLARRLYATIRTCLYTDTQELE